MDKESSEGRKYEIFSKIKFRKNKLDLQNYFCLKRLKNNIFHVARCQLSLLLGTLSIFQKKTRENKFVIINFNKMVVMEMELQRIISESQND